MRRLRMRLMMPALGMVIAVGLAGRASAGADMIPAGAPLVKNGAWAKALTGPHQRLCGPKAYLEERRKEFPQYYEMMKTNENIIAAGIVNALDGVDKATAEKFIAKAKSNVARGVTNTHQDTWIAMTEVAQAYDFFYDSIPPADREAMLKWLNEELDAYTEDEGAFHNSTLSKILCYLRVAYATWGENPRAKDFRDHAIVKLYEGRVLPVLLELGEGGGYTECGWYTRHSLWQMVEGLELARRFEGYDGFAKAPAFYYQRMAYEMLQPYPGVWTFGSERYATEGDGSLVYGWSNEAPRLTRTVLAQYFRGSELSRYVAAKARPGGNSLAKITDFIYLEKPDEAADIKTFPTAHIATGIGKVYARGDWSDDATWLRFECGDYYNGHQHFEVGNFEIFRYEPLATESGEYVDYGSNHAVNWLLRTVAHNCILVYMPGETWPRMRDGGKNKYANDGGQTKKWEWTVPTLDEWKAKRETFERGEIVAYQNAPEYLYVAGDCAAAYRPEKLESWVRQIVFVRPHTFVIYDRVASVKPEYAKTWLLHCRLEPVIEGTSFALKDGKGALDGAVLLPKDAALRKVHGYTYGGETFDEVESAQTPAAAKWRIEVKPAAAAKEDVFLTVLSTDGPVKAELLRDGEGVGARVGGTEVMFSGRVGGRLRRGGKEFELKEGVRPQSFDLRPSG